MNKTILILLLAIAYALTDDYGYVYLKQNNTGARDRNAPSIECFSRLEEYGEQFPKCIIVSGAKVSEPGTPILFYREGTPCQRNYTNYSNPLYR